MKKILNTMIWLLVLFALLCVNSFAIESNIDEYKDEFSFDEVTDSLSDEAVNILNEMGINEVSFEELFGLSTAKIFDAFFGILENSVKKPFRFLFSALSILILTYMLSSVSPRRETVDLVGGAVLSLSIAVPFAEVISTCFSVLESLNIFTTSFSGVFCAIASASGQINAAVSYTAFSAFSNNLFSVLLSSLSHPVINGVCALGFLSCFDFFEFTSGAVSVIKKCYVFFLSFIGTLFSGIVTLRGVLSTSADSLTAKSVRFVVGRSLPVVGGAVSETYMSLVGSLSLLKNTVGVFGIISVCVIVLPSILSLVGWLIAFEIIITFSGVFDNSGIVKMLSIFKDVTVLLIATISITATIMIVSVGVVIALKSNL